MCLQVEGSVLRVLASYTAIKEDEISVEKGEIVHVLDTQHQEAYLVHREASHTSPAAEGWLPRHVFTPQHKDTPDNSVR